MNAIVGNDPNALIRSFVFLSHTNTQKGGVRMAKKNIPAFSTEILYELLEGQDPATVLYSDALLDELKKSLGREDAQYGDSCSLGSGGAAGWQLPQGFEPEDRTQ